MHIEALQLKHTLHFPEIQLQLDYSQYPLTLILGNHVIAIAGLPVW